MMDRTMPDPGFTVVGIPASVPMVAVVGIAIPAAVTVVAPVSRFNRDVFSAHFDPTGRWDANCHLGPRATESRLTIANSKLVWQPRGSRSMLGIIQ
jgi:hypothetical protein